MVRINVKEMTGKLNQLRVNNLDKRYTHDQLLDEMKELGFGTTISQAIIGSLISSEKIGRNKFYKFNKEPIHFAKLEEIYKKSRSYVKKYRDKCKKTSKPDIKVQEFNQKEAIKLLQAAGYQIRKCVGFDESRFKTENPDLYYKYLKYENL